MNSLSLTDLPHSGPSSLTKERALDKKRLPYLIGGILAFAVIAALIALFVAQSQPRFTIAAGDNLVRHVGYERAIKTADRFGLPVYVGSPRSPYGQQIDMKTALATDTDRSQVTVLVYEGDRFDLRTFGGSYEPAPRRGNRSF